ncbi:hypothetical protein AO715_04925 [Xanthomonas sp. Mitacek01]|nr:hypothetical protein AO715_04925 [Xanthomonas sp. Mitacek01]
MDTPRARFLTACLPALLLAAPFASAQQAPPAPQPLDTIRAAALQAVGGPDATGEARLDSRLRLAACSQPLEAVATGPRIAQVRCGDTPGWRLYVPVTLRREADVVVVTGPVRAGEPIDPARLSVQRREVGQLDGAVFSDPAELAGRIPARSLGAGDVLTGNDVQAGQPVKRGDPVVLVSRAGGVEVRQPGIAMGAARVGERVAVQNTGSSKVVRGRLTPETGVVEVVL